MRIERSSYVRSGWSRLLRPAAVLLPLALAVLTAAPAAAAPEGFSDPEPVSPGEALLVYLVAPLALAALVTLFATLPSLIGSAKAVPSLADAGAEHEAAYAELEGAGSGEVGLDTLMGAEPAEKAAGSE